MRILKSFFIIACLFFFSGCTQTRQKITIGLDPLFPTQNFDEKQNDVYGYFSELLLMISKMERVDFEIVEHNEALLKENLLKEKYDMMVSFMKPYNFNRSQFSLSEIFLQTGPVLIIRKDDSYKKIGDFENAKVGCLSEEAVLYLQSFPDIMIQQYDFASKLLQDLVKKNIDAALLGRLAAASYVKNIFFTSLKMIDRPLIDEGMRFVSLKKNNHKIRFLDKILSKPIMKKNMLKLQEKWNLI
ncbi:MAG TPA: transporter substrate-binding domain-containing protein [Chlamydiales bacterium]|nr:transporter substrate-binding domain-containing protein [Chlamydiales bacterium]